MKQAITLLLVLTVTQLVFGQEFQSGKYFSSEDGLMLNGYDPVSYQGNDEPLKGNKEIKVEYDGVYYLFSSKDNKEAFQASPQQFIPQFGGFCAYGVGMPASASYQPGRYKSDPTSYKVVDGKLYLFYPPSAWSAITYWNQDERVTLKRAEKLWGEIREE